MDMTEMQGKRKALRIMELRWNIAKLDVRELELQEELEKIKESKSNQTNALEALERGEEK